MGMNWWGVSPLRVSLYCFIFEMILTASEWQVQAREGLCEGSRTKLWAYGQECHIRPSLRVSGHKVTKPAGWWDTVNGEVVQWKYMFLSGGEKHCFERVGRSRSWAFACSRMRSVKVCLTGGRDKPMRFRLNNAPWLISVIVWSERIDGNDSASWGNSMGD